MSWVRRARWWTYKRAFKGKVGGSHGENSKAMRQMERDVTSGPERTIFKQRLRYDMTGVADGGAGQQGRLIRGADSRFMVEAHESGTEQWRAVESDG